MTAMMWSCKEDQYSTLSSDKLTFSQDSVHLDTVFINTPTQTETFWVFNHNGYNIRLQNVLLERGNQSGFRVNVDGVYLGATTGYQTSDVEIRGGDSIRVFVEMTATGNIDEEYKKVEDNLIFTTEGGAVQKVALDACSWNAYMFNNTVVTKDSTITAERPVLISGNLKVEKGAKLTLNPGARLFFHDGSVLEVKGTLDCKGKPDNEVVLRGYRLDNMFDYLPYDRISGQWEGVVFREGSYGNSMEYTDLHSACNGIVVDSCDITKKALTMNACTVHNCQGYGIYTTHSWIELNNCQITNTLNDCLYAGGGKVFLRYCTLGQFYPFDSGRGQALHFTAGDENQGLTCVNTIITGYGGDELQGDHFDETRQFKFLFHNCIIRTPAITTADSVYFKNVTFEDVADTTCYGTRNFRDIDTENLKYDFRLSDKSLCIGKATPLDGFPTDRNGIKREDAPDIGCFERTDK